MWQSWLGGKPKWYPNSSSQNPWCFSQSQHLSWKVLKTRLILRLGTHKISIVMWKTWAIILLLALWKRCSGNLWRTFKNYAQSSNSRDLYSHFKILPSMRLAFIWVSSVQGLGEMIYWWWPSLFTKTKGIVSLQINSDMWVEAKNSRWFTNTVMRVKARGGSLSWKQLSLTGYWPKSTPKIKCRRIDNVLLSKNLIMNLRVRLIKPKWR